MRRPTLIAAALFAIAACAALPAAEPDGAALFRDQVAPLLEQRCLECHNSDEKKGGLNLETAATTLAGGDSGAALEPGRPQESLLIQMISGDSPEMPKKRKPLTAAEIKVVTDWIAAGAPWPREQVLAEKNGASLDWWSLRPLVPPAVPKVADEDRARVLSPIDSFVLTALRRQGLTPSPQADRRTLIRRVYFDLIGLPPAPEEVEAFVADPDPRAYDRLVDRLLDSPRYGERWARHWLDVVHYGDTHGYDKDKVRPNAWPYRDYVIRSLNADKPYARFVAEQLAGDVLYPGTMDGIVGLGFIAAGPWDFVGHAELPESKLDGQIARMLDRDDMVTATMNTFVSMTVQCARCHNHKFDPIRQEHYYSLQAVFAALDRADRPFDVSPEVAQQRTELAAKVATLQAERDRLAAEVRKLAGPELPRLDAEIAALEKSSRPGEKPEFGYHSGIEAEQGTTKWVQVDLGRSVAIHRLVYVACHDNFNNIGAGFGFPVRFKIEASDDPSFAAGTMLLVDRTQADVPNPGVAPQVAQIDGKVARYVRMTATRLAPRQNDFIFALAELLVLTEDGTNAAAGGAVTALDSIEAPVRWAKKNLVDGYYYGMQPLDVAARLAELRRQKAALLARVLTPELAARQAAVEESLAKASGALAQLPQPGLVYAGAIHKGEGAFRGTGHNGGRPREIRVLKRGDIRQPGAIALAGTVPIRDGESGQFSLAAEAAEGERRAALARWIVDPKNPLTWRSIVNRVWLYHFGRGIVDSPNDFGRMGQLPTHPELLDWLAVWFRDDAGQSLKNLHRLIVTSSTYQQASAGNAENARLDAGNQYLWRMNRRRLEAEAIHDAALAVSGKLDTRMYGPGYRVFGFKDDHSPHYLYEQHDPDDPQSLRRSIYRFIVRSVPDPLMTTLDCADPSQIVEKRAETVTPLSALALLNNPFFVRQAEHLAERAKAASKDLPDQVVIAFRQALGRAPTAEERDALVDYAQQHGLSNACRLLFNMNEFVFVD